ncbi:helix-turn-helix domain-containing protein [Acinetobacter brisouii]|uniref:helix-turn-helix domain-containing protein n=1 Tax=Acinetobacter brisouii TaxID=396323 RepID=UPI00124CE05D|nr:helix-turn-helix transcriptional regulator [Acinetobacter brisouii]
MAYTLGERIREKRESLGLSQQELGNIFNPIVKRASISRWESDTSNPEIEKLPILARKFKTTIDWLVTGESRKDKSAKIEDDYYKNLPKLHKIVDKNNDLKNKNSLTNDDLKTIDSTLEASAIALLGGLSKPSKKESEAQKTA